MADITRRHHWFSRAMTSEKRAHKFHTDDASLPRSGYCFWLAKICFNQSEALPRSGWQRVISMEFVHLFLKRHFAGKPKCRLFSGATRAVAVFFSLLPLRGSLEFYRLLFVRVCSTKIHSSSFRQRSDLHLEKENEHQSTVTEGCQAEESWGRRRVHFLKLKMPWCDSKTIFITDFGRGLWLLPRKLCFVSECV